MDGDIGYEMWLPIVVTVSVWILMVFAVAAAVSKTWADLSGLLYLMASPFVYRGLKSVVGVDAEGPEPGLERTPTRS